MHLGHLAWSFLPFEFRIVFLVEFLEVHWHGRRNLLFVNSLFLLVIDEPCESVA